MVSRSMVGENDEPKGAIRLNIKQIFDWAKKLPPIEQSPSS